MYYGMNQILEFFQKLFDTSDWPPRWHCGNWTEFHGWLYIVSDLLIWSAYFAIPLAILKYITRRIDAKFVRAYFLFAAFILACGSTHLLDAVTFWFPAYRLNALVRFATGVISWVTVFHIIKILPTATSLPTHAQLENEIAERKKVEKELKIANDQLNVAQEIARIGHWEWSPQENRILWSKELHAIFQKPVDGALSYNDYLTHIHPEDKEFVNSRIQQAFEEKTFPSFTHRIKLPNGEEKIIQAKGEVLTDGAGTVTKMIGTAQDITDLQKTERQLLERTNQLESSNNELQKFAYVASHDLREPLRKIMTFASLLDKEAGEGLSERGKTYMHKIVQASDRMQSLIDDILQFSSLRTAKQEFQRTDLNAVLQQVLSDIEVQISTAGAVVEAGPLPLVDAIPSQMGQLFQNLLSNAVKFRHPDRAPKVTVKSRFASADELKNYGWLDSAAKAGADYTYNWSREQFVEIEVRDNGIGFDAGHAQKIFEIFQRLHGTAAYEGTGIGLAICKKIVESHHGTITAQGAPGEGAAFTIVLPVSQKNFSSPPPQADDSVGRAFAKDSA